MVACIKTLTFQGMETKPIDAEVSLSNGLPSFTIVGLPDKAIAESKERVRAALHALGIGLPPKRITINLAPADLQKEGSHFDLPIALGILAAMNVIPNDELSNMLVMGELSLNADIRPVSGILPAAVFAAQQQYSFICPKPCAAEALWAGDLEILAASNLLQIINHFKGTQILTPPEAKDLKQSNVTSKNDLSHVKGQENAKRALEIAAVGRHNMLMIGPPGSGKSMLASCLPSILPPLSAQEALDISMIHSLAGLLPEEGLITQRPFRDPHHSASLPALVGGGHKVKPGEISLAHNGVLFLDELPEFSRATLEAMRQPLETREVIIARANAHVKYPANFQLIAAMNPCRCGHLGQVDMECTKAPRCGADYQAKISGPMLDRFDIVIEVPPVDIKLLQSKPSESSDIVASRVQNAQNIQTKRSQNANAALSSNQIDEFCILSSDAQDLLNQAIEQKNISARGYYKILKVARTIADLDNDQGDLQTTHIAESLGYRRISFN